MFPDPWLLTLCVFAALVALGSTSGLINERLWISEPLLCALLGVALGPVGIGILRINPSANPAAALVLRETARITLAIAVIGAAVRLPSHWLRVHWRGLGAALGPGMLLMWGCGSLIAGLTLGLPLLSAVMVGAATAPTDPVLSAPILTGRLSEKAVPNHLRYGLTAETGINDGLGLPFVMVPVLLFERPPGGAGFEWFFHVVLYEIGGGVFVGAVCARNQPHTRPASMLTAVIALALTALGAARVIGVDGILASFVAGAVLNSGDWETEAERRIERFQEALARFFDLPVMILFGAVMPWQAWAAQPWHSAAFAVGILLLRRIPAWLLLRRAMPWLRDWSSALFAGWFGPIGTAALFYAMLIQDHTRLAAIWPAVSLAVAASVAAHGVSSTPLTWLFGRVQTGTWQFLDGKTDRDKAKKQRHPELSE
jgi:sodium/hydrogen antiporter